MCELYLLLKPYPITCYRAAKKKKKDKADGGKDDKAKDGKDSKQPAAKGKAAPAGSNDRVTTKSQGGNKPHDDGRPESHMTHGSGEDMDK